MQETDFNGIRGVIFDLDGTLIDSFEAIREGFNATLPYYGLDTLSLSETKALVGKPLEDTFCDLIGEENANKATAIFRKKYREVFLDMTLPLPHAVETVTTLHNRRYHLAVATNKFGPYSRDIINHLGLDDMIAPVVGDGDGVKRKPEPDMLKKLLIDMSMTEKEAVFVGDSPIDIETGKKAGVKTIAVSTGYHSREMLEEAGAETVIGNLSLLVNLISCS
ncbi:MAG: HAD family hydrolase [Proteobacteria bacterium]|nr:HAD family hydrolase [Pseudomonadota bacterium]